MLRVILVVLLVASVAGGAYFFLNYTIDRHYENGKLAYIRIVPRAGGGGSGEGWQPTEPPPARSPHPTIHIATFHVDGLDERKLNNNRVCDVLVRVVPRFEIVAMQGLQGQTRAALVRLVEQINAATGRHYDFAACPAAPRDGLQQYSAFVFDQTAVEVDRSTLRLVEDQAGRLRHPPLVAAFRVRGPSEAEAFTFTLVNVHTEPDQAAVELDVLRDVFRAVRDDRPQEDDIILLGDLGADESHLGRLGQIPDLLAAVTSTPTTVRGTRRVDNILFDRRATVEFTGKSGVVDLMRECELTVEAALEVAEHLPVWAEFSSYEGGHPGRVAGAAGPTTR